MTYDEAQASSLELNECVTADYLSQALYTSFQIIAVLSYGVVFYYIVAVVVIAQSACLIRAIVQRRITIMRRRDREAQQNGAQSAEPMSLDEFAQELDNRDDDDESNLFIEGMFGGLLTVPLPVPEILSSLDKTKCKTKDAAQKKKIKNGQASESGLWKQCPICWCDFHRNEFVTTLHCNEMHIFHTECIEQWIRRGQNSCPLCRQQIANL